VALLIITILVSMLASFFCSLLEACLMSLSIADIAKISEKSPFVGSIWKNFRDNIQKPIAVILIINTFACTVGAALAGTKFSDLFGTKWVGLFSIVFALMIILWSEIVPKTLGHKHNKLVASVFGIPLRFLVLAMTPVLVITQILTRPFTGKRNSETADALGDINILTRFASINNLISKDQAKLVMRSIGLSKTKVTDVMMKREQIKYLSSTMTLTDALIAAHLHYHTRYPLVEENDLDKIIGYVNFKDIVVALHINPKDPSLKGIMRPMLIVTETENASVVLNKMTQAHHHIAIVQNTRGIVCGLVTLEDLIEEVIGEIEDEFDILPAFVRSMPNNRYMVGGATPLSELKIKVCQDFPNEATTVDSWVRAKMKKFPSRNDTVTFAQYDFTIAKVRRSQIHEVIVSCKATGKE
jgi:CBS domain containing-hemolysin-like protein